MNIVHQTQPTPYSCNQTCLAMLLGAPVEKVLQAFPGVPPEGGMRQQDLFVALDRCGFEWNAFMFGTIICQGFYLASVPSLNFEGGAHTVLLEYAQRLVVHDPNRGRAGKRFYRGPEEDCDGVPIRCWSELIYVLPGGKLPQ